MNHEKHEIHEKIIYKEEIYQIQGAMFRVFCAFRGILKYCVSWFNYLL